VLVKRNCLSHFLVNWKLINSGDLLHIDSTIFQMEKLDNSRHIYMGDDLWLWHCYPVGSSVHCTSGRFVEGQRLCGVDVCSVVM